MKSRGFTLVELLVAIAVMSLISAMAWRVLNDMVLTHDRLQNRLDTVRTLEAGLHQWKIDLDQMVSLREVLLWDWNGLLMRITRTAGDDSVPIGVSNRMRVVAYAWRIDATRPGGGDWQRWQSLPLSSLEDWQVAWEEAARWGQTQEEKPQGSSLNIHPLAGWELFLNKGGNWYNPFSSDDNAPLPLATRSVPDGLRLVLILPPGPAGTGPITLDWLSPAHQ